MQNPPTAQRYNATTALTFMASLQTPFVASLAFGLGTARIHHAYNTKNPSQRLNPDIRLKKIKHSVWIGAAASAFSTATLLYFIPSPPNGHYTTHKANLLISLFVFSLSLGLNSLSFYQSIQSPPIDPAKMD